FPQHVTHDIGEPGDRSLVSMREPGRRELDERGAGPHIEAVARDQPIGRIGATLAAEVQTFDVGEQIAVSEQRSLEDAHEGQRLFALEMIGEAGSDELAAVEQRLDSRPYEIFGATRRAGDRQRATDTITSHEPVRETERTRFFDGITR